MQEMILRNVGEMCSSPKNFSALDDKLEWATKET